MKNAIANSKPNKNDLLGTIGLNCTAKDVSQKDLPNGLLGVVVKQIDGFAGDGHFNGLSFSLILHGPRCHHTLDRLQDNGDI